MKTPIKALIVIAAVLTGCRGRNEVAWTGSEGFTFNGVELELPKNGIGRYGVTPLELEYEWDGKTVTIRDLRDGSVSVTTPMVTSQVVSKSLAIIFDSAGNLSTRVADTTPPDQEAQQDGGGQPATQSRQDKE